MERNQLKILLLDTEWAYALAYIFPSKKPQFIHAKNIKHHQFCLCAAWKWSHEVSKYCIKITDDKRRFKRNKRDDYIIAKKLHELMTEADVIVAHNGDSFDIKLANTLFIDHGLGPIPEKKSIDTLKLARKYFKFAGNDLDSLSKRFGGPGKVDRPDWILLTESNVDEIDKAATYCMEDVGELERVFTEIKPYAIRLPALKEHGDITQCHSCGSKRLHKRGSAFDGTKMYTRIKCQECGKEHKGKLVR